MSQFETALDDYRNRHPQLTVRDKITGTGRRIITGKGPDGITHKCFIHENRNSEARARLQQRYYQRKHFDILDIINRLLRDGIPAVILSDNTGTIIFYNTTRIDSSRQHKLIKIGPWYYSFESISESKFNQLRQQLKSSSGN